jgi:TolB-like protein
VSDAATGFFVRLRQRKLVQWALAYVAAAFALIQVLDVVAQRFGWPESLERLLILAFAVGFFVTLVLAWYHGERGAQRVTGTELMILALLLALGGGVLWRFARAPVGTQATGAPTAAAPETKAAAIPDKSIAVLPFENLSDDKKNEYFVAGMQDMILTKLADIGDLKVISRTSTAKYASHPDNLPTIAQQLGVATIMEGSVQKAGDQVLINVQLLDARADSHLWAQSYQRTLDNVFGVEGEVAEQIATALKAKLSSAQSAALAAVPTQNRAAYDLFLRAEYQARKANTNYDLASMKAAIPIYRQAVEQDSDFAQAWAQLSYIESQLAWFGGAGEDVKQLTQQARADAERALQLQPDLAAAHLALGYTQYWGRGDYAEALRAFAAALELRPNDADSLTARGFVERRQGRFDGAIASLQQALTLDPRNSALADELGSTYMMASRYADAETALQRALAVDPDNRNAKRDYSYAILFRTGDLPHALAAVEGDHPKLKHQRAILLTYQRKYHEALALLDSIADVPENFSATGGLAIKPQVEAGLYQLMGDTARARSLFEEALPRLQAQIKMQQGINLMFIWSNIAAVQIGLGQTAAGLDAIAKSQTIHGNIEDHVYGPYGLQFSAGGYAQARRPDLAVPLLARLFAEPGGGARYAPVMLWLDPVWDPIRGDPRFAALLQQYAKYKPAVVPSADAIAGDGNVHG